MKPERRVRRRRVIDGILFRLFLKEVTLSDGTRGVKASTFSIILIIAAIVGGLICLTKFGVMDDITGIIQAIRGK